MESIAQRRVRPDPIRFIFERRVVDERRVFKMSEKDSKLGSVPAERQLGTCEFSRSHKEKPHTQLTWCARWRPLAVTEPSSAQSESQTSKAESSPAPQPPPPRAKFV